MTLVGLWFVALVVLWTGFLVLEGFDFGVGMLHGVVGRDEAGRRTAISAIGPVWDGNEVWLVVAVAATFAAFPVWYATMLSGFYPLFLAMLVGLILRGVSFEFRSHSASARAREVWDATLTAGSVLTPFLLGIVLGNLLHGVPIDSQQEFVGGLGDLLNPFALGTGVMLVLLCLLHGAIFLVLRTKGGLHERATRTARLLAVPVVVVVIGWVVWMRLGYGPGVLLSVYELLAVIAVIVAAVLAYRGKEGAAFAATALTLAAVTVSLFDELYPRVMVSTLGAANDLTVDSTSSAPYALTVMTVALAVLLPIVLVYQGWTYHVFRRRLTGPAGPPDGSGPPREPVLAPRRTGPAAGPAGRATMDRTTTAGQLRPAFRFAGWLLAWSFAWLVKLVRR
jgi:cytochrome bd ubiquinol oxidase subunit II